MVVRESQILRRGHLHVLFEAIPVFSGALQDILGSRRRNQVSFNVGLLELALRDAIVEQLRRRGLLAWFVFTSTEGAVMDLFHHLAHLIILR